MSLYDSLGGEAALVLVVDDFYARVQADPVIAPWFDGIDVEALKAHQRAFLAVGLGGPEHYTGRSMRNAHAGLAISDDVFSRTLTHLADALGANGVDELKVAKVIRRIEMMRAAIAQSR